MRLADALTQLLECAQDAIDPAACRVVKNPGGNAAYDTCDVDDETGADGQLWVGHLTSLPGWPAATAEPTTCATPFGERIEIGIIRCARGILTEDGDIPDEVDVTADADRQETDRVALRRAILCCFEVEGKDLIIEGWEPIEPQGKCVGGVWTIVVRDAGCDCAGDS